MLNELVGQFLKTTDGGGLLKDLQAKGMTEQQATQGITATAEGAMSQPAADGAGAGLGGALGGMVGALGGGGLAGMLGGSPAPARGDAAPGATPAAAPGGPSPLAQFVAQKTGLAPAMAEMVVAAVLPRIKGMLTGAPAPGAAGEAPAADPASLLGSLFR